MRVTGGVYRGRKLQSPENNDVRPTSDMMRQAIFNILNAYGLPQGAVIVDAFCGTGALGIEALSRGGAFALFMDKAQSSLKLCGDNIAALKLESQAKIMRGDAAKPGPYPLSEKADLVFLDPPYRKELVGAAMASLSQNGWLAPEAILVIECEKGALIDAPGFELLNRRHYGDSDLALYQYQQD